MILEVTGISKAFGGVKALSKATLQVQQGTITALIGPNGSGKTTLFDCISKLISQDSGTVKLNGNDISEGKQHEIARRISRTFQDPRLFDYLTIHEHLSLAHNQNDYKLQSVFSKEEHDENDTKNDLKHVGLDKDVHTQAQNLSYGQRKLLDLAIATSRKHELLMLDEPVAGVNPKLRKQIKKLLKQLREDGETILLIEHDMNFVMDLADEIYVLAQGRVIAHGTPAEIQNDKKVLEAYLGQ